MFAYDQYKAASPSVQRTRASRWDHYVSVSQWRLALDADAGRSAHLMIQLFRRAFPTFQLLVPCFWLLGGVTSAFCQTWTLTTAPTNSGWQAMACSADGSRLIATGSGIYASTNSGVTWTAVNLNTSGALQSATSSSDGIILALAGSGGVYVSTNSGANWQLNRSAPQNLWYWSIACSADGKRMITAPYYDTPAGNPQLLYMSQDFGTTWASASAPSNHWSAVASSADGSKLLALAFNGPIYVSTNSGKSWATNAVVDYWRSVACSADGTKAVAVAEPGSVYTTTNSGASWSSHFVFGASPGWGSVASSADGVRLFAVGFQGGSPMFVSTNSGNSWIKQPTAPQALWNVVTSSADGHKVFAATYGFLVNNNSGGIYTLQTAPSEKFDCTMTSANLDISWSVPSVNFVLQQILDLTSTNWFSVTNNSSFDPVNLRYHVTIPITNALGFYRLAFP